MAEHTSFAAFWARMAVRTTISAELGKASREGHGAFWKHLPVGGSGPEEWTPDHLPKDPRREHPTGLKAPSPALLPEKPRICIVGAGVTGLYIAMILDSLNIPGLTYDILEGSSRTGGRMLTHYFSETKHDYYDIGAMRFPHIKIMDRTFDLFEKLKIPLIPYYLDPESKDPPAKGSVMTPTMYNDICIVDHGDQPDPPFDPFRISTENDGSVPAETVEKGVSGILDEAFGRYKDAMAKDFKKGFEELLKVDNYSTREYLKNPPVEGRQPLDFFSIQWLETNNTSTNLFDQAFSESVIDSFDFAAPEKNKVEEWSCIDGGTSLVTKGMEAAIKGKVQHWKRVTKITQDNQKLVVSVQNESKPRKPYDTVFNTTSLGCLQRMDLTGLSLHPSQKDAIRSLHYDDSAKVAIKFSYPWWIKDCGISSGGTGNTDMPLRTCVYPSYNLADGLENEAVLLCSYTWAQDATRMGSLISPHSPEGEDELLNIMFDDLARLHLKNFNEHSSVELTVEEVRTRIKDAYVTHHAFSWTRDPFTSGAFALFGPGQFQNLYPYLTRPAADGRFHMLGEASSAHHAWIVGSLDSAWGGVYRFLDRFCLFDYQQKLKDLWKTVPEFEEETKTRGSQRLQVGLGSLPEGEHIRV